MDQFKDLFYMSMGFIMGSGFGLILVIYVARIVFGF